ncbi:MOSC domain-containing protein [Aquibium sp. ELW1220]|uniref:MOSC domain-containing protein n=1 Tax=Aquibium sp. ELW1220 TaxID=2976766 RepID=UPI0025AFBC9C|nr:MOSC domain-containing protein [Aquibium sp. ELW1220]MDN2582025.1 MOSC domain-containing protein [Aquibium sp. ELW1220]
MNLSATIDALFIGTVEERWPGRPPSAIGKRRTSERLEIGPTGFPRDAQADLAVHGGREKAIHHYPGDHYAAWRAELGRDDLVAGGFGENVSTVGLTEETLCIGDVLSFGGATVQVSQGRQPCWKLAAHTAEERMAYLFQKTGRTGWYYRVLEPGHVAEGDTIRLVERPRPGWTVKRVTLARLSRRVEPADAAFLADMPELYAGWREAFAAMALGKAGEDTAARLKG